MATKRVLVVEDDAALARVLRDNRPFEGFLVARAGDGHLAARSFGPDLVLLDLMLPDRDGFELFATPCDRPARGVGFRDTVSSA